MTNLLLGKTALVTGGAQGMGAGIAHGLAAVGCKVVVTDVNAAGAAEVAGQINLLHGEGMASSVRHDVTSEAEWIAAVEFARAQMGGLSVLVNNAGILTFGSVEDLSLEAWRRGMSVNVDSVFLGCKHALPLMRESQPGSIVNISSVSALIASHNLANYNASKAAVWMLTKSVALHCAKQGWDIRCNSIHPTFIRTPMLQQIDGEDAQSAHAKLARQIPLGRIGEVEDVAAAVIYLASNASRLMTGSELKLDGGLSAM
jgi:NAD(P)-dependent dehydrogenase (short-subunit alcohol dehydrogenase family)